MPRFLNNVNLLGNKLQNAVIDPLASDPGSPVAGQIWFNTAAGGDGQGRIKVKLSTRTIVLDDQYVTGVTAGGTPNGISVGGTALAPTISMLLASGSQIGAMATADYTLLHTATNAATNSALVQRDSSGNAAFNTVTLNNAPVAGTDAVNLNYVQSIAAGFDPKASVKLATTGALPTNVYANGTAGVGATLTCSANTVLTSTLIDGTATYAVQVGDRVLVKNEAAAANNGIYTVTSLGAAGTAPWVLTRATDYNTATSGPGLVSAGSFMFVEFGANAVTQWVCSTSGAITMGTTGIVFTQFGAASTYTNGNGLSLGGNTFSVNLTGTTTLEFNSGALRVKSSATANQVLLSGGTGVEPVYGPLPLGNANAISGQLATVHGGTGVDNTSQTQNLFWASPNGSTGAVTYRAIVPADLPTTGTVGVGTYTKVTVDAYGRISGSATLATTDIPALDFSKITTGIVPLAQGGTGLNLTAFQNAPTAQHLPARVVATSNITLSAPGATIDGVAMAAGDRVLLTAQGTGSQNGLWIWNSSGGAMTRPLDYPAAGTVQGFFGMSVEVFAGTAGAGTEWYLSTTGAITIDTTTVAFTQFPTNLTSVVGTLALANGGTGSGTAAGARTNLNAAGRAAGVITGDGSTTSFAVNHNLASTFAQARVLDPTTNNEEVFPNVQYTNSNTCTVVFSVAPSGGVTYNVEVQG